MCGNKAGLCHVGVSGFAGGRVYLLIHNSVMNVVTDIMILCLPVRFVLRLQMRTARKVQVLTAFGLGGM